MERRGRMVEFAWRWNGFQHQWQAGAITFERHGMQLGKLHVSQELQQLIRKTAPIGAQRDQRVTSEAQNFPALTNLVVQALHAGIGACEIPEQLDGMSRAVWERYACGSLNDNEVADLQSYIEGRRPLNRRIPNPIHQTSETVRARVSRFRPRQHPRSPNRKASRDRRRRLGGSGALPDGLRHHYTEGQRSVLCIIVGEVKHHGICDLPIDKIAALAGVCRTTVQTTMHEAQRLGHIRITPRPRPGKKSLTNIVEVTSPEWKAWIKRGPSAARFIGSKLVKTVSPTKSIYLRKKEAFKEERNGVLNGTPPPANP